jgi:hypothetical protein
MKTNFFISMILLFFTTVNAQESYTFFDSFTYKSSVYELKIASNVATKSYKVKICKSATDCEESSELSSDFNSTVFCVALEETMAKAKLLNAAMTDLDKRETIEQWKIMYNKLFKNLNKKEVITELYDNQSTEYSGKLKLKKTVVATRFFSECDLKKRLKELEKKLETPSLKGKKLKTQVVADLQKELNTIPKKTIEFKPEYSSIRFYNNRINTMAVVGKIDDKEYTIRNSKFSVPFRFLNNNQFNSYLYIYVDGIPYAINWDDLLDYNPQENEFNFTVKNKNYKLQKDEEIKIESRNLFDYFTAIVFSDFLGLNNSGNNSLLMAEGRAIIPLALVNKSQHNMINYFEGYLTTSLYNGQEEGTNFVTWKTNAANSGLPDKIALFDFFKKRNIETGLNFGIYNFEWKGISTNIIFDYGVQFYRTKLRYVKDTLNTTEDFQVYCIGHGPKVKFEIRPQVNFGADLNIGFLGFNFNGMNSSGGLRKELKKAIDDKPTFLNNFYILSNFYTKLNDKESNSGLYFRLGAFYDFDTSDIAPQVMVGYATNLTSFINKFKKKDETKL